MNRRSALSDALFNFETHINIVPKSPSDTLAVALSADPRAVYYISSLSTHRVGGAAPKTVYDVKYQNTDVPRSDIHMASNDTDVISLLCQYVGNYKTRLVIYARPNVDIREAYKRFMNANAVFYSNFTSAESVRSQFSLSPMVFYDFTFEYRIGKVKLRMMQNETEAEIRRIADMLFLPSMSDAVKVLLAHNYLAYTIDYTLIEDPSSLAESYMQSAYGGLIRKKCVCQGYAEAFKLILDHVGIPCDIVCGQTKGSDTYHAWNIVRLNDGDDNYHIDVTWDSTGGRVSHEYFGLSDMDFSGERTWNREYHVKCDSRRDLYGEARAELSRIKTQLIRNGVDQNYLE